MTDVSPCPLLEAALKEPMDLDVIERLLESGTSAVATTKDGLSILHLLCGSNDLPFGADRPFIYPSAQICNLIQKAVANGADVNASCHGWTPLWYVVAHREVLVFDLLRQLGATLAGENNLGDTILHWAAREGSLEMLKRILKAGGDPAAKNKKGETPLAVALLMKRFRLEQLKFLVDVSPIDDPRLKDTTKSREDGVAIEVSRKR